MVKHQRGAVTAVMNMSLFVLLLLSGLQCSASGLWREYQYINISMTWTDAQSYCRERYTDLATVDSMDDVDRIINTVNDGYSGSVWIGLQNATQSRWVWSNGEDTISQYNAWNAPPTSGEECVLFANNVWCDCACEVFLNFVCYSETTGYIVVKNMTTWIDAQSYCREYYTDLATVRNAYEQNQLHIVVGDMYWVWIGLFLDSWQWSDQWNLTFRNWAAENPFISSGDCVAMSTIDSGKWIQHICDQQYPFICYGVLRYPYLYQYINISMTWTDAQSYCREKYTDLATVDSMDDVNRMIHLVNETDGYRGSVWIGLQKAVQSRWVWSNGEDNISQYNAWATGRPFGQDCVLFAYNVWYDFPCQNQYRFVCYNDSTGYIRIYVWKNWTDAQSYCRQYHTDLATIHNSEEQKQLYAAVVDQWAWVWIGLYSDSWQWSDQWNLTFRNWAAGHPFISFGDCAAMSTIESGKWVQYSCNQQYHFICYGEDKFVKRQIVRLNLAQDEKYNLNDPSLQNATLNELVEDASPP
ncbi:macrophage mannose receptor 1-like [Paramisgurnus dabryanus]|uniref:macrophage mannose receptor 1-like n=1 Tax=Paramisgurnus dabryanus TaxID=90735 RepID=UPI003CCF70A9